MKRFKLGTWAIGAGFAFLLSAGPASATTPAKLQAQAELKNPQGQAIGRATLVQVSDGVRLDVEVKGLTPGKHGMHFHEKGSCEGKGFEGAGAHYSVEGQSHGMKHPQPHLGDLPNLEAGKDGVGRTSVVAKGLSLDPAVPHSLLKSGGTSLVIHAQEDDQTSQPSGNSGGRVACGVITAMQSAKRK